MKDQLNEIDRFQKLAGLITELEDKTMVSPDPKATVPGQEKESEVTTTTQLGDKLKNLGVAIKSGKIKQMDRAEVVSLSKLLDNIVNKAQKGSLGNAIKNTDKVFMSNTKSVKP